MFRHPNYYKELRKLRNKLDQAISDSHVIKDSSDRLERAPGPGPKRQAATHDLAEASGPKRQASEDSTVNSTRGRVAEPEASSNKLKEPQASSGKHQAPSTKAQA